MKQFLLAVLFLFLIACAAKTGNDEKAFQQNFTVKSGDGGGSGEGTAPPTPPPGYPG